MQNVCGVQSIKKWQELSSCTRPCSIKWEQKKANFKTLMIRAGLKPDIFSLHAQVRRADFLAMPPFVHNLIGFKEVLQTTSPSYKARVKK